MRRLGTVLCALSVFGWAGLAQAAESCPGNPDALGTSRTLVVDPVAHPRIGTMQYRETLPLADHEVVITFDDGPLPKYSKQVLATLDAQCVKVTYFLIGRMAQTYPEMVREIHAAGHTIGTHSQNHPLSFQHMSVEQAQREVDDGIASVTAALGGEAPAPFFRIPGLLRAAPVESYLESKGLMAWSADFPADDWKHINGPEVMKRALARLEIHHKGILLLHDIHANTASMLPALLHELKVRGYHVVHVVPSAPGLPPTPTAPDQWYMHPPADDVWPRVATLSGTAGGEVAAPNPSSFGLTRGGGRVPFLPEPGKPGRAAMRAATVPTPPLTGWPRTTGVSLRDSETVLPVPAMQIFELRDVRGLPAAVQPPAPSLPLPAPPPAAEAPGTHAELLHPAMRLSVTTSLPAIGFP